MAPVSTLLQQSPTARAEPAFEGSLDSPVVRVRARFGNTFAAWGSGFFIADWLSSVITARHVIALAGRESPAAIEVLALSKGRWIELSALGVAYPSGGVAADDIAIVRVHAKVPSYLWLAALDSPVQAEVWGYPLGRDAPRAPLVVSAKARPRDSHIWLDRQGRVGMSGGPIVTRIAPLAENPAGSASTRPRIASSPPLASALPAAVLGVYLGPASGGGGRAYALADPAVRECMEAAMEISF